MVEIPMSFQVLRVTDVAQWYRWINSMGLTTLVELDCKEQFNRVRPEWVVQHISLGHPFPANTERFHIFSDFSQLLV